MSKVNLATANQKPERDRLSLTQTAAMLGVSYSTARRLMRAHGVARYSTTRGNVVYPGTHLKRGQRARMSYVITHADVAAVEANMRGLSAA